VKAAAAFTADTSTFSGYSAEQNGGSVFAGASAAVVSSSFTDSAAVMGRGGAIFLAANATASPGASDGSLMAPYLAEVTDCSFARTSAAGVSGPRAAACC
jgi:hypothetical protein